jgi:adenine phosphoribosyltransferase
MTIQEKLLKHLRNIPDFPKPGIQFKDITPVLNNPELFRETMDELAAKAGVLNPTRIAAIESRGFIFGSILADRLGLGFVPIRKPGKLPYKTYRAEYLLEYGTDGIEMHIDAVGKEDRVLLVDDVLATGGTISAAVDLVRQAGAEIAGILFLVELSFLGGRSKVGSIPCVSLISL